MEGRRGRPPKPRLEGGVYVPDPVPGDNAAGLDRIVTYFRATHPEQWEQIRLCPLQHGLEDMVRLLGQP